MYDRRVCASEWICYDRKIDYLRNHRMIKFIFKKRAKETNRSHNLFFILPLTCALTVRGDRYIGGKFLWSIEIMCE